jgi:hypothetical protein
MDDRVADANPISDRGKVRRRCGLVAKPSADFRPSIESAGEPIRAALFFDHACVDQLVVGLFVKKRIPPETFV